MGKEITNKAIFLAVNELALYVSQVDERLNSRMDALETRIETMDKDIKQEFSKVNEKIDVVDTQLVILSEGLTKTQAEVKVLQNVK
ncbi:MAG TPA: hypothetical protein GXZ58_08000 [Bacilli bacterium]|nr:hypothetical protein [Bacilli bacterium]